MNTIRRNSSPPDLRKNKIKHHLLNEVFTRKKILSTILDGLELMVKTSRVPLIGKYHPFLKSQNNIYTTLPVNVDIKADSVPLPPAVAIELIKRSKHLHILDKCLCRHGRNCENHTHDIGCLFLGATGLDIVPSFSHKVSEEEAIGHVENALKEGLLPTVGRFRVDNYAFLTPDKHTLLGICFCCSCCCFLSYYRHAPQSLNTKINPWLSGLQIDIDKEKCQGCGTCMETCYMDAISIENGTAVHAETCRGCGRCAKNCPNGTVTVTLSDPTYFGRTVEKYYSIVKLE